jgi:heparan-alpha-glucosaminide N-acetyltransferase
VNPSTVIEATEHPRAGETKSAPVIEPCNETRKQRLVSLDAFRGAIMLLMASSALGIPQVARSFPESAAWRFFAYHFDHVPWAGCALWDLIQPAFMFMVGVALPWSVANRRARGQTFPVMLGHALWRSAALVLLAVVLTSNWSTQTEWIFTNVLAQIGLGYPFLFMLAFARTRTVWMAVFGILFFYWLAFALHPLPPPDFDWKSVGVPANWPHLTGFAAHWEKSFNFAMTFDRWFLNLFPREKPWLFSTGGYQTLNFIPSMVTMILGLLAGRLLRSDLAISAKVQRLALFGISGIILGQAIEWAGLCPIVKRIWTPSWVLYSGGVVVLLLAAFVAVIDWRGWNRWAFPLVVAGLNPITLYCLWQLMPGWIRDNLKTHLGQDIFNSFGVTYAPILERAGPLLIFWLILWWMYRRKIFLRV